MSAYNCDYFSKGPNALVQWNSSALLDLTKSKDHVLAASIFIESAHWADSIIES